MSSQSDPPSEIVDLTGDDETDAPAEGTHQARCTKRPKFTDLSGRNSFFAYAEATSRSAEVSRSHLLSEASRLVSERGFASLVNEHLVNDEVINTFLAAICLRRNVKHEGLRILTSYFFPEYERTGYAGVQRWFATHRNLYSLNLYEQDLVLIPVNKDAHWMLACVQPRLKRCILFDSLKGSADHPVLQTIFDFFQHDYHAKRQQRTRQADWTFTSSDLNRQQVDHVSCGVFVCRFAELAIEAFSRNQGAQVPDAFPNCFEAETTAHMRTRIERQIRETQHALKSAP
jgi:Ulp1 family protease